MNSFDHVNNILTVKNVKKPFKGLHTPGKRSAYKPILLNYLMTWTFSMCLT